MKVRLLFGVRFDLLSLVGLLVGLAFSSTAPAQEAPDVVWEVGGGGILSPDGQTVVTGDFDGELILWDVASGDPIHILSNGGEVRTLAFSPDSQMLASAGGGVDPDSTIKLWRVSDGALLHALFGHGIGVSSVDFYPDGTMLISSGTDVNYERSIRFWRTADGATAPTIAGLHPTPSPSATTASTTTAIRLPAAKIPTALTIPCASSYAHSGAIHAPTVSTAVPAPARTTAPANRR